MSKHQRIRVAIVEDDLTFLHSLKVEMNSWPFLFCVGAYETCEDLLKELQRIRPDVVLMDLGLPSIDGIQCTRQIKKRFPRTKVLVLSGLDEAAKMLGALSAGADGYMVKKTTPPQKLAQAIVRVYEGGSPISPEVANELVNFFQVRTPLLAKLSPTEQRALEALDKGLSYKEAAEKLGMTINTFKTHVKSILYKSGAASIAGAAWLREQTV